MSKQRQRGGEIIERTQQEMVTLISRKNARVAAAMARRSEVQRALADVPAGVTSVPLLVEEINQVKALLRQLVSDV